MARNVVMGNCPYIKHQGVASSNYIFLKNFLYKKDVVI